MLDEDPKEAPDGAALEAFRRASGDHPLPSAPSLGRLELFELPLDARLLPGEGLLGLLELLWAAAAGGGAWSGYATALGAVLRYVEGRCMVVLWTVVR